MNWILHIPGRPANLSQFLSALLHSRCVYYILKTVYHTLYQMCFERTYVSKLYFLSQFFSVHDVRMQTDVLSILASYLGIVQKFTCKFSENIWCELIIHVSKWRAFFLFSFFNIFNARTIKVVETINSNISLFNNDNI